MIGEIRGILTPYYDLVQNKHSFKKRPALIIAQADASDYVVLPISRVTRKQNLDIVYDVLVDPAVYPLLNLTAISYIRTHKQTIVHFSEIGKIYGDLKSNYEELYIEILEKRELFSKLITDQAL